MHFSDFELFAKRLVLNGEFLLGVVAYFRVVLFYLSLLIALHDLSSEKLFLDLLMRLLRRLVLHSFSTFAFILRIR